MESLSEFLYGKEYCEKLKKFNNAIDLININYREEIDITTFFTLIPSEGKMYLNFDQEKEISNQLREEILLLFNEIWN